jgi:hypothetical protein
MLRRQPPSWVLPLQISTANQYHLQSSSYATVFEADAVFYEEVDNKTLGSTTRYQQVSKMTWHICRAENYNRGQAIQFSFWSYLEEGSADSELVFNDKLIEIENEMALT